MSLLQHVTHNINHEFQGLVKLRKVKQNQKKQL